MSFDSALKGRSVPRTDPCYEWCLWEGFLDVVAQRRMESVFLMKRVMLGKADVQAASAREECCKVSTEAALVLNVVIS